MIEIINECLSGLNHFGDTFVRFAAGASLQTALLVIVLFGMDLLLRKRVRAVVRYCVWLLVLVKLVLPPTFSLPTGIGYWAQSRVPAAALVSDHPAHAIEFEQVTRETPPRPHPSKVLAPVEPAAVYPVASDSASAPVPARLTPITWQAVLLLLWLVGMLAFVALLAQRVRFVRGLVAASSAAEGPLLVSLEACCRQMRYRGQVRLRTSNALPSPAVCGLWRPTILMPASLVTTLSPDGVCAALIHELAHIKRADLWVNAVQTALQVVYFYNPFAWFANAMISRTCEEAVDETVLVTLGGQASDYSNTLIKISEMAHWKTDFGLRLIGVAESRKALKRRITHMLTRPLPQNSKIGAFSTIAILLIAAVLLPMARGERSSQETSAPSAAATTEASETNSSTAASDVLIHPDTGVKFVLAKTFSGANNVLKNTNKLNLSPSARFLVQWGKVLPLDGTRAFRYTERWGDVRDAAVSPNGQYIAHGEKAIWLQPVSPETLRPDGPAKKLLDLGEGRQLVGRNNGKGLHWTRDSQTVFFAAYHAGGGVSQYAFSAATGAPVSYPDAVSTGLPSPDGKCIALTLTDPAGGFWVKPIGDGAARLLGERPRNEPRPPMCWSNDGHWLIGDQGGTRFVRYPEGQEYRVSLPKELVQNQDGYASTCCVGPSADKSKLFFYQTGHEVKWRIKVASAEGTALRALDSGVRYAFRAFQWARDGEATFQTYQRVQGKKGLLMSPLSGAKPVQFALSPAVSDGATPLAVSPDSKWLLFTGRQESGSRTLNVIPLSMADHGVSGQATVGFRIAYVRQGSSRALVWSPDSTRVALTCKVPSADEQDIWVAFRDGRTPIRLTRTAAIERDLKWSPDGNMLAFVSDDGGDVELKVISTASGEAAVIRKWVNAALPVWGWSPDGKSLTISEEGMLVRQPLSGGKAELIVNLKKLQVEVMEWLGWSPDGSRLALAYRERSTEDPLASPRHLLFARVEGGHLQQTAVADIWGWSGYHAWSPDSTHVAYLCEEAVQVRPAGRLYEVAVDDVVERIEAGAIPATQSKAAEPTTEVIPPKSKPTSQQEPITGSVFSDNFDNGLSKCWQIVNVNTDTSPPSAHAVENGQLMLSNSSARLSQIDWADYRVTVRVCVKEWVASGEGTVGIETRATRSNFGLNNVDRYSINVFCHNNASTSTLWLGLDYRDASGAKQHSYLGQNPHTMVRDRWYKLAFEVRGEQLRGYLDDKLVIEATDARLSQGGIGLSTRGSRALFDDFSVRRLP
jgi:beta-lactamase regulating signal transducer with metallopeptidase domain/Tol biopolymer transport system component